MKIQRYWKAIAGALAPGAVAIVWAVTGDSVDGSTITTSEWILAVCAIIISGGAVYAAPANDYSQPVDRSTGTTTNLG